MREFQLRRGGGRSRRRILVIDDEPSIALLMQDVLQRRGFDVVTHEGGEEALDAARDGEIDLVLSDLSLPDLHGLEFARRLFALRPELPIVIVSADIDADTREELALLPNVAAAVRKPFDVLEFQRAVDRALAGEPEGEAEFGL